MRNSSWRKNDCATKEDNQIEPFTCSYGSSQLISGPTHILHSSSPCIDLIFTNQPNFVIDGGVHPSLHPNCHHQIIFLKINLKIE